MANKNEPFGLRAIGKVGQNRDNQGLSEYSIANNYATTIYFQDAVKPCLLYTSPSPRDGLLSRMPSSA